MDKLVERQPVARPPLSAAPALAVQFFLIPLAVVAVTAGIYLGFRTLLADNRTAADYLAEIRSGGENRRWPAAYELSRLMADPSVRASDETLVPGLLEAYDQSASGDPRVRQYLVLALGRLGSPVPEGVVPRLTAALEAGDPETQINAIWALGALGTGAAVGDLEALYSHTDAGVRKMVVYALGAIPDAADSVVLETALADAAADVQWNAAVALARHGRREGVPVLGRMLDREYVAGALEVDPAAGGDGDPAGQVLMTGLQAAAALRDATLRPAVERVSASDPNLRVRQAALEALEAYGG
ncbi:MAG: HEAT repeat domain-containing protein [Acidimicrobiia bacterium]|nr:HEAT repeat domain-containing protein [Acidimicrobiia bacterium]